VYKEAGREAKACARIFALRLCLHVVHDKSSSSNTFLWLPTAIYVLLVMFIYFFFYCLIPMTVTVCKVVFHLTISFCSTDIDDQVVDLFLNMCPNFKVFGPQIFPRRAGNFWPNFCKLYTVQP